MVIEITEAEGYEIFLEHVQFEVTGKCNMRCPHCRAWNEPRINLPKKVMKNILDFVQENSQSNFGITISGGEPFVRKDLGGIIQMIRHYPVDQVTITTNGSLSSDKQLDDIVRKKGNVEVVIQVSIDNINAVEHDRFRGFNGAFAGAVKTILAAKKLGLISTIRSTICSGGVSLMRDLVVLAQSLGVSSLGFGTVVPFGRAISSSLGMASDEKRNFLLELTSLKKEFDGLVEVVTEDPVKFALGCNDVWDFGGIDPSDECSIGGCTAGINTINVTSDGLITPCAVLPIVIVDPRNMTAAQIGDEYRRSKVVRDLLMRSFTGKCGKCDLKRICGGCRAISYAATGDLLGSDGSCWLKK